MATTNTNVNVRVQRHRNGLRMAGLRPVQIWVPDTRKPGFVEECRRQSQLIARADKANIGGLNFLDEVLTDIDDWTQ